MLYLFALVYGFSMGGAIPPSTALVSDTFGLRNIGTIFGVMDISFGIGAAIGPTIGGFVFDVNDTPSYILKVNNGVTFDYNDGPNDKRGPNKREWKEYIGKYTFTKWGQKVEVRNVSNRNGYLYFDKLKLKEYQPGLFFSSAGEAFDLRTKIPTYQNTRLIKRIDDSVYKGP